MSPSEPRFPAIRLGIALACKSTVTQGLCLNVLPIGLAAVVPIDAAGLGSLPLPILADPSLRGGRAYFQLLTHHPATGRPCMLTPTAGFSASKRLDVSTQGPHRRARASRAIRRTR